MAGRRVRLGSARSKTTYKWVGIQWPGTALAATQTSFNIVDSLDIDENGGATMIRVRGNIMLRQNNVGFTEWALKMIMDNVDDAGTLTSDASATDTDAEDIARRQFYTRRGVFNAVSSLENSNTIDLEIDVRTKVKIRAKQSIFLIGDSLTARVTCVGYLRALLIT